MIRSVVASRRVLRGAAFLMVCLIVGVAVSFSSHSGLGASEAASVRVGAAITPAIHYQGRLLHPNTGAPLSGSFTFVFRLYNTAEGGVTLWSETKDIAVGNELFTTLLGDATPLPLSLFDGQNLWLGVKVGADAEMTSRQRIAAVSYALYSDNADRLDGQDSSAFASTGHHHDAVYLKRAGPDAMTGSSNGTAILSVTQSGLHHGVSATTASSDPGEAALYGRAGATAGATINSIAGVFGTAPGGRGVIGSSVSNDGVLGFSNDGAGVNGQSLNGYGVDGLAAATSGSVYGVRGVTNSTNGGASARGQGPYRGVQGVANASSDVNYGVHGSTLSTGGYGGYFDAPSGRVAGRFVGNVQVTGTLSKGGGSFVIDHPLDPTNKYLYHSFVESPDMMNVYNGNVTLDESGAAWMELPAYFKALNRNFRYQLTPIGGPGPNLYIAQEVQNNRFLIAGGWPGLRVSWQVTGIRQDPFANANRIQVEVEKSPGERGAYLHPEAYGADRFRSVDYQRDALLMQEAMMTATFAATVHGTDAMVPLQE